MGPERAGAPHVIVQGITPGNWREFAALAVTPEQARFVAEPMRCLARAYAYRHQQGRAVGLSADGRPVGIAMTRVFANDFVLEELLIAQDVQGRGFGRAAATLLIDEARRQGRGRTWVTVIEGNDVALRFFRGLGFCRRFDLDDEDELSLCLEHRVG